MTQDPLPQLLSVLPAPPQWGHKYRIHFDWSTMPEGLASVKIIIKYDFIDGAVTLILPSPRNGGDGWSDYLDAPGMGFANKATITEGSNARTEPLVVNFVQ